MYQLNRELLKAKHWASDLRFCFVIEPYFQSSKLHSHMLLTFPSFLKISKDFGLREEFEKRENRQLFERSIRRVVNRQTGAIIDHRHVISLKGEVKKIDGLLQIHDLNGVVDYLLKGTVKNNLYVDLQNLNLDGNNDSASDKRRNFNIDFEQARVNFRNRQLMN